MNFLTIPDSLGVEEISPSYGEAPIIDGTIDKSINEWEDASKISLNLYSGEEPSPTDKGLPVDVWVMFNETFLYVAVQFELEEHNHPNLLES